MLSLSFCSYSLLWLQRNISLSQTQIHMLPALVPITIGCIVLYTGQGKFHSSTANALDYVVDQANKTAENLKDVSEYLASAKRIGVDQVFLPANITTGIDEIQKKINSSATILATQTTDNSEDIEHFIESVRLTLIILSALMLLLTFIGFYFLHLWPAVFCVHPGHYFMDSCYRNIYFVWGVSRPPQCYSRYLCCNE